MSPSLLLLVLSLSPALCQELKVLVSDGCLALGETSDGKAVSVSPGAPLVLTHQIRLLPLSPGPGLSPDPGPGPGPGCGCEGLADLRLRVQSLEQEVSVLREKCGDPENPGCCGSKESQGTSCSIAPPGCPGDCSDQGRCVDGRCVCFPGFSGADCAQSDCPGNCADRGRCVGGVCECDPGFSGPDCSESVCPEDCSTRGRCVDGRCQCQPGFTGPACAERSCPGDCSSRGRCVGGVCVCDPGFSGQDCSEESCAGNCNHRGRCVNGKCVCEEGYSGDNCQAEMLAVEQIRTEDLTQSSVTVVWTQPPVQYESYLLTFTSQKDLSVIQAEVPGSRSSFSQSGLAPGQSYSVTVTGATGERRGAPGTASFTTLPSGPSDLRVVKSSTSSVVVQWEPSLSDVDRYRLSVARGDGRGRGRELTFDPGTSSAHITELEAGLSYDITLVAERGRSQSQPISTTAVPGSANVLVAALTTSEHREVKPTNAIEKSHIPRANFTKVVRRIELNPSAGTASGSGIDLAKPGPKTGCLNRITGQRDQSCRDSGEDGTAERSSRGDANEPEPPQTNQPGTDLDVVSPDPLQKLLTDTFQDLNITAFDIRLSQSEPSNMDADAEMVARQIMQGSKPFMTVRKSIKSSQHSDKPNVASLFLLKSQSPTIPPISSTTHKENSDEDSRAGSEKQPLLSRGNATNYRRAQPNQTIVRRLRPNPRQFSLEVSEDGDIFFPTSSRNNSTSENTERTASLRDANVVNLDSIGVSDKENQGRNQSTRQGTAPLRRIPANSRLNVQNLNRSQQINRFFRRPARIQNQTVTSKSQDTVGVMSYNGGYPRNMENINGKNNLTLSRAGFNRSRPGFPRRPSLYMGPFQNRTRLPFRSPQGSAVRRNWVPERAQNEPSTGVREGANIGSGVSPSNIENIHLEEDRNRLSNPKMLVRDSAVPKSNMHKESHVLAQQSETEQLYGSKVGPEDVRVESNVHILPEDETQIGKNNDFRDLREQNLSLERNIALTGASKSPIEEGIGQGIQEDLARQESRDPKVVTGLHATRTTEQFNQQSANINKKQRHSDDENSAKVFSRRPFKPETHPVHTRRRILPQDQARNGTKTSFNVNRTLSRPKEERNVELTVPSEQDKAGIETNGGENAFGNGKLTLTKADRTVLRRLRPNLWQFRNKTGINLREGNGSLEMESAIATGESSVSGKEATNLDDHSVSEGGTQYWKGHGSDERSEESFSEEEEEGGSQTLEQAFPQTDYKVTVLGKGSGVLNQLHKLVISTGPEPPSDLVFSHVTEDSVTVSWTRPKSRISGFKVTYTHQEEGEPVSVSLDQGNSSLTLSRLTPGSEYEVSVLSVLGLDESDAISKTLLTLPDPPTELRAVNVSDSGALLLWRPSLATVDHYSIVYGAGTGSEVRVSVSGNTAQKQLNGLEPSTTYSVTISSQLDARKSRESSTTFMTTSGSAAPGDLRATNVRPRSATLSWKPPARPVIGYRVTYWTEGQRKEVSVGAMATQMNLTRLFPGSKYEVELQTDDGGEVLTTAFTTGALQFPFPADCSQEQLNGLTESGLVDIFPLGQQGAALSVWCDMDTDGGGWTVFQRRKDGSVDFFRTWREYVQGFGDPSGEFWLGLDPLHALTSASSMSLRVDLSDGQSSVYAVYENFAIAKRNYRLTVGGYSGTAGDSMSYHNSRIFSTKDRDPGSFVTRCAMSYRGGWWYKNCHEANLNGLYGIKSKHQGIIWTSWKGKEESIPFTEMKMRPRDFISNSNNFNNYRA